MRGITTQDCGKPLHSCESPTSHHIAARAAIATPGPPAADSAASKLDEAADSDSTTRTRFAARPVFESSSSDSPVFGRLPRATGPRTAPPAAAPFACDLKRPL